MTPAWQTPLRTYLGTSRIIKGGQEAAIERDGQRALAALTQSYKRGELAVFERVSKFVGDDDLDLHLQDGKFAIVSRSQDRVVAAMTAWFPYNDPQFRGRSLIAHVLKAQEDRGHRMSTGSYTVAGLLNRVKAHRLHLQAAADRGEIIHREVMADYACTDGQITLKAPFDPQAHNRKMIAEAEARQTRQHAEKIAHLRASFQQAARDEDGHLQIEQMVDYLYLHADAGLALAIKIRHGGEIRVTKIRNRHIHQVQIGDEIIDAYGICPVSAAQTHLRIFYKPAHGKPPCFSGGMSGCASLIFAEDSASTQDFSHVSA